jgi:hypothetical protein
MGEVSGGIERGVTAGLGAAAGPGAGAGTVDAGGAAAGRALSAPINSLIRSTVDGSRLAKALTLTSSPHFWIRSSRSWLLRPSSFASSWTRVDKGNSSWMGLRPKFGRDGPRDWSRVKSAERSIPYASAGAPRWSPNPGCGGKGSAQEGGSAWSTRSDHSVRPMTGLMVDSYPHHFPRPFRPRKAPWRARRVSAREVSRHLRYHSGNYRPPPPRSRSGRLRPGLRCWEGW